MKTPEFLEKFIAFRDSLMKGGTLSKGFKEKIAYLVSVLNECDACIIAYRKHLKEFGCGVEVEAIEDLKFDDLDEKESIAINAAYEVVKNEKIYTPVKIYLQGEEVVRFKLFYTFDVPPEKETASGSTTWKRRSTVSW